jgi:O-Antigen ligase
MSGSRGETYNEPPVAPRELPAPLGALARSPGLLPALAVVAAGLFLGASEGGYPPTTWYPTALLLLGLLAALAFAVPPRRLPGSVVAALVLLAAFAAWSFLSIAWADQPGAAWDGANRTLAYAIVFGLAALWPLDGRAAHLVLGALGLGVALIGAVELIRIAGAADPGGYFIYARLAEPVGYQNGDVAFWMMGLLPCVFMASRRQVGAIPRGVFLGGATLLSALVLMGQSRSWLFALPIVVALFVAVVPGRLRTLLALGAVAAGSLAFAGPVLAVHDDFEVGRSLAPLVDDAASAVWPVVAVVAVLGALAALLDRRFAVPEQLGRRATAWVLAALAALLLAGGVAGVAATDDPAGRLSDAWSEFKEGGEEPGGGESRFTSSLGTDRYDFWRVAWERFEDRPLTGIGADNFQLDYLRLGTSGESPRFAHSIQLGVLSQTGLIGALLLAGALGAALFTAVGVLRRGAALEAAAAGGALTVFGWWFVHGAVDWFWEFPALAGIAFGMLGVSCALAARPTHPRTVLRGERGLALRGWALRMGPARLLGPGLVVVLAALAAVSFAAPWLAERDVRKAGEVWRANPAQAFDRLERAADLNPLTAQPALVEASIALRLGDLEAAERMFAAALEREPLNPHPVLELGLIAAEDGSRDLAARRLRRALELSPQDEVARRALRDVMRGRAVSVDAYNDAILREARRRVDED